jgi:biofilm PGA synthesis N-glycosyltransferase PgaC
MAGVWIMLSGLYFERREGKRSRDVERPSDYTPFVSIIVPAYCEEQTIRSTLEALIELDYPRFEVIVANDGSTDRAAEIVGTFLKTGIVRLLHKEANEGKAKALNDAVLVAGGEILLVVDADIVVTPRLLRVLVPHFLSPRVGAVSGNPRVANRDSFLGSLQTLEFASIISVQRRAQRVWGRILTVSGAVFAIRKTPGSFRKSSGMFATRPMPSPGCRRRPASASSGSNVAGGPAGWGRS